MKIYFVRHAQSTANIDANVLKTATNMSIGLSDVGVEQANETGLFLSDHFSQVIPSKFGTLLTTEQDKQQMPLKIALEKQN